MGMTRKHFEIIAKDINWLFKHQEFSAFQRDAVIFTLIVALKQCYDGGYGFNEPKFRDVCLQGIDDPVDNAETPGTTKTEKETAHE